MDHRSAKPGRLAGHSAAVAAALPGTAQAQQAGWGNLGKDQDTGFSFTAPLWPEFWMAWTPATFLVFVGIFSAMAILTVWEVRRPGGDERKGILRLETTRGDRLFLTLLGTAYIFMAWLGIFGMPLWAPLGLALAWGAFCFLRV
jgi:predicted small integral membrane protein